MLQSKLFPKTRKEPPKDAESINHKLLVRAGFIDQLMAGSWTLLPLGLRVVQKINNIIREEMNVIGGQELLMPLMHPKELWNESGRWEKAKEVMYQFKDSREKEFALSFTHEEIVMDLLRKNIKSYQDLPVSVYHFSTKFRNEARARSGILRGREFMMKDLYSAHVSEEDMLSHYEKVKRAYSKIFNRLGFNFRVTDASGGVFTESHTHEFQVMCDSGEDKIFYCDKCDWGINQELNTDTKLAGSTCPKCKTGKVVSSKSIEVGNIFPLGTWYAEKMGVMYTDASGNKKPVWFASYGIGPTRVLGTLVEVSHDDKGIVWYPQVAPFEVHMIELRNERTEEMKNKTKEIYRKLSEAGIEVLWDDRQVSAGEKFADADLIGIPVRLVVSEKTLRQNSGQAGDKIEYKERSKEDVEMLTVDELINRIKKK